MTERPNPTSAHELPHLYEQDQLTPAHWQEVLNRIDPQHEKVIECAIAIIEGRINKAAPYLLKADWRAITTIDSEDVTKTPRHFPLPSKITHSINPLAQRIKEFATKMQERHQLIDDWVNLDRPHWVIYRDELKLKR